jgi:Spy/CpxP family protein refolding chaperone
MIRRKLLAAAALGLFVALPLATQPAAAEGMAMGMGHGAMGGMHGGGSPFLMLLKSANLTADQQSQVRLILNSNKNEMMSMHKQLMDLHEQISAKLLSPGAVTSADLKPLVQQASGIEAKLNQSMADTAIAIRNVLTPAQVSKLAEVHNKLHKLHSELQGIMGPEGDAHDDSND